MAKKFINPFTGKKTKENGETNETSGFIRTELVGMNRAIDIIAEACSSCWDKKIPDDWAGRAEYVAKRTRTNHTSILEHSNFIVYINIPDTPQYTIDMVNFISWIKYLNKVVYKKSNNEWCILLGGSYRGFSDIYLQCDDLNNSILKSVAGCLYTYAPSAAFEDICKLNLMDITKFANVEPDENFKILSYSDEELGVHEFDDFKIIGMDNISALKSNIMAIDKDFCESLKNADLIKFVTVTVLFKDMSRIITQQLCRHRNAITQESQRYVNYADSAFNSPAKFKAKYDADHKYKIDFGGNTSYMTLQELGDAMCKIYGMVSKPEDGKYPLDNEDARAYLPSNVKCRKIYMTFTYASLFKFLQLREAAGAQAEIKYVAINLGEWFRSRTMFKDKETTDLYTKPKILIEDPFTIDVEWEEDSVIPVTEDDYMNYLKESENAEQVSEEPVEETTEE